MYRLFLIFIFIYCVKNILKKKKKNHTVKTGAKPNGITTIKPILKYYIYKCVDDVYIRNVHGR
jgi:hypothetical protein